MTALDLVYNPVSGSFSQAHLDALVAALEAEGFGVTPMPTTAQGAQLSGRAELICVHGGDGTGSIRRFTRLARCPSCPASPSGPTAMQSRGWTAS